MRLAALCELPMEELVLFADNDIEKGIVQRWEEGVWTRRVAKFALLEAFKHSVNSTNADWWNDDDRTPMSAISAAREIVGMG